MSDLEYWKALCGPLGLDVAGYSRRVDVLVEFPSGYRAGFAPEDLLSIAAEHRNHVIRELMEKIGPKASVYSYNRYGGGELEWDYSVAEWLKAQLEGE